MNTSVFAAELAHNHAAYERLKEEIGRASPGEYAAIAQGRLISIESSFDEALSAVERLQPRPEHYVVFPVDEEPAFDVIDDFRQGL